MIYIKLIHSMLQSESGNLILQALEHELGQSFWWLCFKQMEGNATLYGMLMISSCLTLTIWSYLKY